MVPRTLTCWPASFFNSSPAAVKLRSLRFQHRDGEIVRPAAPEIDVNRAAAFPHGQDFALNHRETTPNREDPRRILGMADDIIRVRPKAKTARPRRLFRL